MLVSRCPWRGLQVSAEKKKVRQKFRDDTFKRDGHKCRMCGWNKDVEKLDAHHITDRTLMPNGGYVKENGISLCQECHVLAEIFHSTGMAHPGYAPEDLYKKINSTHEKAVKASERLK